MLLGFISLLLTVGQSLITNVCIPEDVAATWHPCSPQKEEELSKQDDVLNSDTNRRKLLAVSPVNATFRRVLAGGGGTDKCAAKVWKIEYLKSIKNKKKKLNN